METLKTNFSNTTTLTMYPALTTCTVDLWGYPELVSTHEVGESIEMIYKQTSTINLMTHYPWIKPEQRVYKIVYSCKDGKWHKSGPIYGKIIPAKSEHYAFES